MEEFNIKIFPKVANKNLKGQKNTVIKKQLYKIYIIFEVGISKVNKEIW